MTYLRKNATIDEIIAFDSGPGNMMINEAVLKLYQKKYDKDGKIASKGSLIDALYQELMQHPYYLKPYPKSTGRELFGRQYIIDIINKYQNEKKEDIIHTISMVTVDTIVDSYQKIIKEIPDELILCGGGAHNLFIRQKLKEKMKKTKVLVLEDLGYSSDYKEALAFIILANQTICGYPSNVKNATGAKHDVILGQISKFYKSIER